MSGHNKWSKIKHKKAIEDNKKSKEFSKYAKLITLESKLASGNMDSPGLKRAVERARAVNMPSLNIDRAIKRGADKNTGDLSDVIYEAYGPGGSAIIIEGFTDNKNRTSAEIKHILSKNGYQLAEQGSVLWAFLKNDGVWSPKIRATLSKEDSLKLKKISEELEESDDVEGVYTNE